MKLIALFAEAGFTYEYPGFLLKNVNGLDYVIGCDATALADSPVEVQIMEEQGGKGVDCFDCETGYAALERIRSLIA